MRRYGQRETLCLLIAFRLSPFALRLAVEGSHCPFALFCPVGMEEDDRDGIKALHPAIRGLKTVCRCNNVKYKTLERVVREGATTVAQVAAKTTATTGYCGGSCTPYIQEMIAEIHGTPVPAKPSKAPPDGGEKPWWER